VVLVHGVSGPMSVWDETVRALRAAGRAFVRLDLYGRGGSARLAPEAYTLPTYVNEVGELIERLAPSAPVHLVGSSMGAIVVSELATRWPERTRSVTLVGPAGFPLEATPAAKLMNAPVVGEWAMASFGDALLAAHQRRYFVHPERFEAQHALFGEQLRVRGSKRAILETLRRVPLQHYLDGYAALAAAARPVLVLWGTEDRAFPFSHHEELAHAIPAAVVVPVADAGHLPQLERADEVGPRILAWLDAHD
jgi:pimeloyl-ACP methyl ester carboxylesterase